MFITDYSSAMRAWFEARRVDGGQKWKYEDWLGGHWTWTKVVEVQVMDS